MSYIRFLTLFMSLMLAAPLLSAGQVMGKDGGGPHPDFKPTIGHSEAVRALQHYQEDPIRNLESAEKFMTYISEQGTVHVSMTPQTLPWMFRSYPPAYVQAVLLSAFMAGNFQAQLDDRNVLDDPEAGMRYVLDVYQLLQAEDPDLAVPELEQLLVAKDEGRLEQAIEDMVNYPSRDYSEAE